MAFNYKLWLNGTLPYTPALSSSNKNVRVYVIDRDKVALDHKAFAYGQNGTSIATTSPVFNAFNFSRIEYNNQMLEGFFDQDNFYGLPSDPGFEATFSKMLDALNDDEDEDEDREYTDEAIDIEVKEIESVFDSIFKNFQIIPIPQQLRSSYEIHVSEDYSHATGVASVIAGQDKVALGHASGLSNVQIISVPVGYGNVYGHGEDLLNAIKWSLADCSGTANTGCVINISLSAEKTVIGSNEERIVDRLKDSNNPLVRLFLSNLDAKISQDVREALIKASKRGIAVVIGAGNDRVNACDMEPAGMFMDHVPEPQDAPIIVVGSTNQQHQIASFSNYGPCVTHYAPGVNIPVAKPGNNFLLMQGSSFSAPLISGILTALMKIYDSMVDLKFALAQMTHTIEVQITKTPEINTQLTAEGYESTSPEPDPIVLPEEPPLINATVLLFRNPLQTASNVSDVETSCTQNNSTRLAI